MSDNLTLPRNIGYSLPAPTQLGVGFDRPNQDASASLRIALFLCPKYFMVGTMGILRGCWSLDPVCQPVVPTAQRMTASVGSLKNYQGGYHV